MTDTTFNQLLITLIDAVDAHPHREELLRLMEEQIIDDTNVLLPSH